MTESLTFGRWMKCLRAELDLTQEALAEAAGCAPQTIRTYESGTRRPSRELAERLADVLQVAPEERADFLRLARTVGTPASGRATMVDQAVAPPRDAGEGEAGHPPAQADSRSTKAQPESGSGAHPGEVALDYTPILTTKLYVPRPRAGLELRPRLLARNLPVLDVRFLWLTRHCDVSRASV